MLGKVFARFVEKSPISVMVRGTLERVLGADQLDAWFARTAQKQYTRTVLFSTVYDVLSQVVFRIKPSVRAAYRDQEDKVGASVISLYNKLNGVETHTSEEFVRYSAAALRPLIAQLDGERSPILLTSPAVSCQRRERSRWTESLSEKSPMLLLDSGMVDRHWRV